MKYDNHKSLRGHSHYYKMALQTDRRKRVKDPDGYGRHTGKCGDTVEIFLMVDKGHIYRIFFETDGCLNTTACANTVACLSEGKTIMDAWDITPDDIINYLETLPPEETHCAELAAGAFFSEVSVPGKCQGTGKSH